MSEVDLFMDQVTRSKDLFKKWEDSYKIIDLKNELRQKNMIRLENEFDLE